jgi:hypothetical protein
MGNNFEGTLFPGGKDIIFGWSFQCGKKKIIIKPYNNKDLVALMLHFITIAEYGRNLNFIIDQEDTIIKIPPVIGLAKIATNSYSIPVLITTESEGEMLIQHPRIIGKVGKIAKSMALEGFIVDLFPSNWRYIPSETGLIIEYIDLINSNNLSSVKERVSELYSFFNPNSP